MKARVGAIAIMLAATGSGCGDPCGNEEVSSVPSPSGAMRAVVFTRSCGATTDFSTQVSVLRSGQALPNEGGNVFVEKGKIPLSLLWRSEQALQIAGTGVQSPYKKESSALGVAITYSEHAL